MMINNGSRVHVSLPGFSGLAGYVEGSSSDEISFASDLRVIRVKAGQAIQVVGIDRVVKEVSASPFMQRFVVIKLSK